MTDDAVKHLEVSEYWIDIQEEIEEYQSDTRLANLEAEADYGAFSENMKMLWVGRKYHDKLVLSPMQDPTEAYEELQAYDENLRFRVGHAKMAGARIHNLCIENRPDNTKPLRVEMTAKWKTPIAYSYPESSMDTEASNNTEEE